MTTTITAAAITSKQFELEIKEGLIFILNHLEDLWPRMISTHATRGGQRLVNSFAEAFTFFKDSFFLDCRISAYPKFTDYYIDRTGIAPTVLMVDIDKEHFETPEEFVLAVANTYTNFEKILGSRPTLLWTGGGQHFIMPQNVPVLEKIKDFQKFDQPSRKFLQFEERLLSDNNADESHWKAVSFNNMMLRIPGTLNSSCIQFDGDKIVEIPYDARVRVERYWDGNVPKIEKILLMQYHNYLQFSAISNIRKQKDRIYGRAKSCSNINGYDYIEKLFDKPLDNFRKSCIWKILIPYCINVKKLPRLEAFNRTKSWLDRCNSVSRLNFNPKWKIDYALDHVGTFYPPYQDRLEDVDKLFYERLKKEGII